MRKLPYENADVTGCFQYTYLMGRFFPDWDQSLKLIPKNPFWVDCENRSHDLENDFINVIFLTFFS